MAGNNGGPWGGSGGNGGDKDNRPSGGGGRKPGQDGPQIPEIDDLLKKGQDQLRVLMGGKGGGGRGTGGGQGGSGGPGLNKTTVVIGGLVAVGLWALASFYSVKPEEKSVEFMFGKYHQTGEPGLNFAPWPIVKAEIVQVTREQIEDIGVGGRGGDAGLMLTGDENIVDIDFQVVWNVRDPAAFLFNLRDPQLTIRAVSESAMREIIAQSSLAPILNRDRGAISQRLEDLIQSTLDSYNSGVNIVRVNFDKAEPPQEVIAAFRDVQAAEQDRDRLQKEADAYSNRVLAEARGDSAQILEEAEGYRAEVVNQAEGEASRFSAVLEEYQKAPEVTRKRLFLETMERIYGRVDKVIIENEVGDGVVPYLPLNELTKGATK
ncbi:MULTISPECIES: FtsH protease activity modulator HflK [Halocynthiibacter]|uniref:Protein HflK n=1 Tax=Halocynthiibacter halioticoli TaxID=2986804 RepID=A0AAE3LQT8_9RHOB|nr:MULTISPECIES: FtsH protease activity modulator HflK [Halocynthiibacter]MCV6823844.1 FtsH protease activity modulator HflK [Halocynthiibacter halioticoli]MCW4056845.1 FtsH protease activity modulator HflK [Halocynthiibacter sp. SDUM655004]MDE0590137.1 FtsH protease activity modulator HflK [Halocynthiibacter sp. C4]